MQVLLIVVHGFLTCILSYSMGKLGKQWGGDVNPSKRRESFQEAKILGLIEVIRSAILNMLITFWHLFLRTFIKFQNIIYGDMTFF